MATEGRIFISYRRQETAWPARQLYEALCERFGVSQVFKDVDNIAPGEDFVARISSVVGSCRVLLAMIGPQWLQVVDEDGNRRIDDPDDFVRLEVATALSRGVLVVPILVDGARMPKSADLPPDLAGIARRQAIEINPTGFNLDRLFQALDDALRQAQHEAAPGAATPGTGAAEASAVVEAGPVAPVTAAVAPQPAPPAGSAWPPEAPGPPAAELPPPESAPPVAEVPPPEPAAPVVEVPPPEPGAPVVDAPPTEPTTTAATPAEPTVAPPEPAGPPSEPAAPPPAAPPPAEPTGTVATPPPQSVPTTTPPATVAPEPAVAPPGPAVPPSEPAPRVAPAPPPVPPVPPPGTRAPGRSRLPVLLAAAAVLLVAGGVTAWLLLGNRPPPPPTPSVSPSVTPTTLEPVAETVTVDSVEVATGVQCSPGRVLSLTASGETGVADRPAGPDGSAGWFDESAPLPDAPLEALIGRVGQEWFFVGDTLTLVCPAAGELQLGTNSLPDTELGGSLTAEIISRDDLAADDLGIVELVVPATESWVASGFSCTDGEEFRVSATGKASAQDAPEIATGGPDGVRLREGEIFPGQVLRTAAHRSLLGRVDDGDPFLVGSSATLACPGDGELELQVNDGVLEDNTGEFAVSLSRWPQ